MLINHINQQKPQSILCYYLLIVLDTIIFLLAFLCLLGQTGSFQYILLFITLFYYFLRDIQHFKSAFTISVHIFIGLLQFLLCILYGILYVFYISIPMQPSFQHTAANFSYTYFISQLKCSILFMHTSITHLTKHTGLISLQPFIYNLHSVSLSHF